MSVKAEMGNRADDSSPGLSSPPSANSPPQHSEAEAYAIDPRHAPAMIIDDEVGGVKSERAASSRANPVTRRPRKSKAADGQIVSHDNIKAPEQPEKKKRAPRGTSLQYQKKMAKKAEEAAALAAAAKEINEELHLPRKMKIIGSPELPLKFSLPTSDAPYQNGNNEAIQYPTNPYAQNLAKLPRPSSGQNYDPIRSATFTSRPISPSPNLHTPPRPAKHTNPSASASPSISTLIDPPDTMRSRDYINFPKHANQDRVSTPPESKRQRLSPPVHVPALPAQPSTRSITPTPVGQTTLSFPLSNAPTPMEIDSKPPTSAGNATSDAASTIVPPSTTTTVTVKKATPSSTNAASSTSHSPKPSARQSNKESTLAIPTGSGLLSGSIFGASAALDSTSAPASSAPTVVLNIPLTGENQYINFSKLAEERYGFNALHPRLAAQRERLARVAAAGAALENAGKLNGMSEEGEKSEDLSMGEDGGEESNVEIGGMGAGPETATAGADGEATKPARKKRMTKEDMYDKDDGFVDDTELAWEEQAAVSKDGFFVYSGLLVPEGEEAKVERYGFLTRFLLAQLHRSPSIPFIVIHSSHMTFTMIQPTDTERHHSANGPPRRGRGGGRGSRGGGGPGSRGGRGGAAAAAAAAGSSHGNSNGTKEGKAPGRKPRITKAEKERMEREKTQRENLAPLASKPANYPMTPQVTG